MKYLYILFIVLFLVSCGKSDKTEKIVNFNKVVRIEKKTKIPQTKTFNIAISAMLSPVQNFDVYKPFLKYMQDALNMPVKLTQRKSYKEVNYLIKKNMVNLAFICTGAYVHGDLKKQANVIAIPEVNGKITYHAYIIVNSSLHISSIWGLKGKMFAFMDPLSNTGYFYPMELFRRYDINPKTFFKNTIFTYSHTYSIEAVADGIVSAASVDGIVYNYAINQMPILKKKTKILIKSPKFPMPPVVVPKQLSKAIQKKIQNILLNMNKNHKGEEILKQIGVDKFVVPPKDFYNDVY